MKNLLILSILFSLLTVQCKPPAAEQEERSLDSVSRVDSGNPVAVMMTAYSTTMLADGEDRTLLRVALTDSNGREITSASGKVRIYAEGDASLAGTGGEALTAAMTDTAGLSYRELELENGICQLMLVAGKTTGIVKIQARYGKLWPGGHEIHLIPADIKMMVPSTGQLPPVTRKIDRMIGADISFLPQMEDRGRKFYVDGVEQDAIRILKDHGFNYIRLRIFVNPENEKGYSPGTGFCDLSHTLDMARRVNDAGMKLLLNFHYSDYWADPQQQNKPAAWAGLDYETLKDSVRAYTAFVIRKLEDQDTPPGMVQVGNEINHGLLWPDGHIGNPDQLAGLLKAGVSGVRDVDPDVPLMMHVALGGQNEEAVFWFNNMIARGVEFDVIGVSYYPRWHGRLEDLYYNLTDLVERYHKPVNVVEYAVFAGAVHDIVFNLPEDYGKGTCIWEPLGRRGNFFDAEGNMDEGILIYDKLSKLYLEN